jgi:hypothetical protein
MELAERSNDGVVVRLLWDRYTRKIVLEVTDDKTGTTHEVQVPDDHALEAFQHPFVYVEPFLDAAVV